MKNILSFLGLFYRPTAIGLYITFFVTIIALQFYITRSSSADRSTGKNQLLSVLGIAHQKSIDFRLQARGPRAGSDQVVLLAVDERSVSTVGRWPWPREKIGLAIEQAVKYGAKALAFDMVFSEPSAKPGEAIFDSLESSGALNDSLRAKFRSELEARDSDLLFSKILSQNAAPVVLGVFSQSEWPDVSPAHLNSCVQLISSQSPAYKTWKNETSMLAPLDEAAVEIPPILTQFYSEHLKFLAQSVADERAPPQNATEDRDLKIAQENRQRVYCQDWLDPEKDELFGPLSEAWPDLKAQDPDYLTHNSFQEWADEFKSRSLPIAKVNYIDWVMNIPSLSEGVNQTGFFNAELDSDGTIRRKSLIGRSFDLWVPSIAFKAYLIANNLHANFSLSYDQRLQQKIISRLWLTDLETGDEVGDIPVDEKGRLTINYAGPQKMFPYVSIADLLTDSETLTVSQRQFDPERKTWIEKDRQEKKSEFIKGKTFIVGATAMGIFDLRVTPFDENYPGAETHVNVIDNLVRKDFLRTSPKEEERMLLTLLCLGIILSLALSYLGALSGLLFASFSMAGFYFFDRYFLFGQGMVTAIIFPFVLVLLLYISLTFYKYFTEERGKKELRTTFQKYVSPAIVEEILSDPSNVQLGGRKVRLTVFFSDVRGFTTISEKLDPQALSSLLNRYLTPMTELVFKNRGTLDKYMGDAIMAFFGAPIHFKDHAKWACRCALESLERLKVLQNELIEKGLPSIDIGIGLNTGEVSVGNMGSETVRSYTVMGDAVNLGSRLEGITKEYGVRIVISEFTYEEVKEDFICREVDWVKVKGKILPVKIYELMGEGKASEGLQNFLKTYKEGTELYHQAQFKQALAKFEGALQYNPADTVAKLYVQRCHNFMENPPPSDWDGVFVMKTK